MKLGYVLVAVVAASAAYGIGVRQQTPVSAEPPATSPGRATQAPPLSGDDQTLPPNHPPIGNAPESAEDEDESPAAKQNLAGQVKEVINVPSYTYMRIQTDSAEIWAAVPTTEIKVGDKANVVGAMEMKSFTSKTLKRTFDSIYFGTLDRGQGSPAASPHPL